MKERDRNAVREFLMSCRARIRPADVGLLGTTDARRVPGLRRAEVAILAGVSLDYYTRIERGNIAGASDAVLNALSDALLLDGTERAHLFNLARNSAASTAHPSKNSPAIRLDESVQRVVDGMDTATLVENNRLDIVGANELGRALYAPIFAFDEQVPNSARFMFLDPAAAEFYDDWPLIRRNCAAMLRREVGRDPLDENLTALIGELSARSPIFRQDWANHQVHHLKTGKKAFHHPAAGFLELEYNVFEISADEGLRIVAYDVEPGSPFAQEWSLLTSIAATARREGDTEATGRFSPGARSSEKNSHE